MNEQRTVPVSQTLADGTAGHLQAPDIRALAQRVISRRAGVPRCVPDGTDLGTLGPCRPKLPEPLRIRDGATWYVIRTHRNGTPTPEAVAVVEDGKRAHFGMAADNARLGFVVPRRGPVDLVERFVAHAPDVLAVLHLQSDLRMGFLNTPERL